MNKETPLADLATGRFELPQEYLVGVQLGDLKNVDAVSEKNYLLMTLFIKQKLLPNLRPKEYDPMPHRASFAEQPKEENLIMVLNGKVHLNLKRCVSSNSLIMVDLTPISQIINLPELQGKISTIQSIDLSYNYLTGDDLPELICVLRLFTQCVHVDLSSNRLFASGETQSGLLNILSLNQQMVINICATAFASIDSKQFFLTVDEDLLKRIIWIPKSWYKGAGWYAVVPDAKRQKIIFAAHDQFYS
ncbi:hypothetical protein MP638_001386 [Amoeboaphelidium occidentale]|nr:hypothetical protein MP638_001386 [Amoeboaphelidium occidentale]